MKYLALIAQGTCRFALAACGLALILTGIAGTANASFTLAVPEIDPSSAAAAVALVLGGAAMLRHRRK